MPCPCSTDEMALLRRLKQQLVLPPHCNTSPCNTSPCKQPFTLCPRSADGTVSLRSLKQQRVLGQLWGGDGAPKQGLAMSVPSGDKVTVAVASGGTGAILIASIGGGSLQKVSRRGDHAEGKCTCSSFRSV